MVWRGACYVKLRCQMGRNAPRCITTVLNIFVAYALHVRQLLLPLCSVAATDIRQLSSLLFSHPDNASKDLTRQKDHMQTYPHTGCCLYCFVSCVVSNTSLPLRCPALCCPALPLPCIFIGWDSYAWHNNLQDFTNCKAELSP